jgi:peptidyl-prolyl cis-trans isomerase B (cyclophilin B)
VSSSNKRQRALARQKYERQQQRRADSASRRRTRQRITGIAVVLVLVAGAIAWVVIGRTSQTDQSAQASASPSPAISEPSGSAPATAAPASSAAPSGDPSGSTPVISCTEPGTPRPDNLTYAQAPPAGDITSATITLETNCGPIVIETLPEQAPVTVASEAFLATEGFYDQTSCHRLTTAGIFVLQCGDPKGNGTGGPGYSVPDENLPAEAQSNYPAGTVAMANAGPGTAGSQFFIVYQDTTLPAGYTIWGKVVQGLDIVQGIAAAGVEGGAQDGPPAQPVFINKAIVTTQ